MYISVYTAVKHETQHTMNAGRVCGAFGPRGPEFRHAPRVGSFVLQRGHRRPSPSRVQPHPCRQVLLTLICPSQVYDIPGMCIRVPLWGA